jgi:hypothetical protein
MKKLLVLLTALIASVSINAADIADIGIEAGYNNHYTVNGVSRAEDTAFVGFNAIKSLKFADVYVGGTLLPSGTDDQSHWVVGLGKTYEFNKDWSARLTTDATRHQAGGFGIPNSTEFGVKLALNNPYVTPYVRGAFDIDLNQNGVYVGAQRVQSLFYGFTVTPAFEYGYVNDYKTLTFKGTLARPFKTSFGTFTPFAEVGWYDNDFNTATYNWATREFSGTVVYTAGLKLNF